VSHTLHRHGVERGERADFVVLAMSAKGHNDAGSAERLRDFLRLARRFDPVNLGDMRSGSGATVAPEHLEELVADTSIVHAVYDRVEALGALLAALAEAELGVSVVVSGLFAPVHEACARAGLTPHTVERSLGIWGRVERLPEQRALEVATMCGHGLVGHRLIAQTVELIRAGHLSPVDGAQRIARPCACGIFNPARAAELLAAMAAS
jgi:hypothetical protein